MSASSSSSASGAAAAAAPPASPPASPPPPPPPPPPEGTDASLALPSAINSATSLPSISLKKAESLESSTSAAAAFERSASSSRQSRVSRGARSHRVASRRVARRSRRTSGENRLHIGLGRRFLPGELRLRVAKRESASVVVPKALAPSFAVPRRPRFRPLACPRARSRRPETNERFLSLASLERSGAPPIARPRVPSSSRARCPRALVRDRAHQQVRGDVFHRVRCACVW